jgi:hypothetical protein
VDHRRNKTGNKKFPGSYEYENTTYQKGHRKAFLRGKFIVMNVYIKRKERYQINDLMLHLKLLEKQEQAKPKISRREIIKIRAENNEIKTKKPIQMINETKSLFFEKYKQDGQDPGKSD